jgi:uncharacterized membrane protein
MGLPALDTGVFISTFLASTIEVIEMVAIVVAVGATRSWRASLAGAAGGLLVLVAVIALLGTALQAVPLEPLRFVIGALLLAFGSQWYRKGIERVSRDGWTTGSGVEEGDDGARDVGAAGGLSAALTLRVVGRG